MSGAPALAIDNGGGAIALAGAELFADCAGALYWPAERLLIVSDLHLEKGSSFARAGMLLPPYDTAATLARLAAVIARYAPRTVVALGDSFHDRHGASRLAQEDRDELAVLQRGRRWLWILGNHDPEPDASLAGEFHRTLAVGGIVFVHEPDRAARGEIAGHLHPSARIVHRGRAVTRRCFAADARRIVLPAFGAYAGGLSIRDPAFAELFGGIGFTAHMIGRDRLYSMPAYACC